MKIDLGINLYGSIVVLAIFLGLVYIFKSMKKEAHTKNLHLYFMLYFAFAFAFGMLYSNITKPNPTGVFTVEISAYGGLIGTIIAAIIFEKIQPMDKKLIKYTIISLPLVYGISKIACFLSGCCGGIPYNGLFYVIYPRGLNIPQFPIQIVEALISLIIFLICHKLRNNKNIAYITLILIAIVKASLDFLRYDHLTIKITTNQIFSIVLILITILVYGYQKMRITKNRK